MTVLCAIEGHAYAGKTTLLNYLNKNSGFACVGEYDKYVDSTSQYPDYPHTSQKIAFKDVDFFIELDMLRKNTIEEYTNDTIVFIDRFFISLILFQKYTKMIKAPNEYDAYEYAKYAYRKAVHDGLVSVPDCVVFVRPKDSETHNSRLSRKISAEALKTESAYEFFNTEYDSVLTSVYSPHEKLLRINSSNNPNNLRDNASLVINFVKKQDNSPLNKSLLADGIFESI